MSRGRRRIAPLTGCWARPTAAPCSAAAAPRATETPAHAPALAPRHGLRHLRRRITAARGPPAAASAGSRSCLLPPSLIATRRS